MKSWPRQLRRWSISNVEFWRSMGNVVCPWVRIQPRDKKFSFFACNLFSLIFFFLFLIALSYSYFGGCSQTTWTHQGERKYLFPRLCGTQLIVLCKKYLHMYIYRNMKCWYSIDIATELGIFWLLQQIPIHVLINSSIIQLSIRQVRSEEGN